MSERRTNSSFLAALHQEARTSSQPTSSSSQNGQSDAATMLRTLSSHRAGAAFGVGEAYKPQCLYASPKDFTGPCRAPVFPYSPAGTIGGGGGGCKHSPQATGRQSTCKPHPDHCPHYPAAGLEKGPHREWVTYPRPCLLPQAWELPQPGTG